MTLQEWIDSGGCMLSTWTTECLKQSMQCNEKVIRATALQKLLTQPTYGQIAARELMRFATEHELLLPPECDELVEQLAWQQRSKPQLDGIVSSEDE